MTYRLEFGMAFGSSSSGLTLHAALLDQSGVIGTQDISSGFHHIDDGFFQWDGNLPTGWQGSVVVYTGSLSGNTFPASGVKVKGVCSINPQEYEYTDAYTTSRMASGGSASLLSGQLVSVYSGQLSGQLVTAASGQFVTVPIGSISGAVGNSGQFVTVPVAALSGVNAVAASGVFSTVPTSTLSGLTVNSGLFVTVPTASISGAVGNSGLFVSVPVATLSGVNAVAASGVNAVVPVASISGANTVAASGVFATVPPGTLSGVNAVAGSGVFSTVPPATLSGVNAVAASGAFATAALASGQLVGLYSGQVVVTAVNQDKLGYGLSSSGLDLVSVEAGMNARQALTAALAVLAGQLSGAGTTTVTFCGAGVPGTNRVTATVDRSGNRTTVTLNLPG